MTQKNRHLGTIALLCRAISSQLRHVSTIGKKLVKQRYVLHMSPQYGELRPTSSWDRSSSLRHPCKFQGLSRLGSVTSRHLVVGVSQTAALNRACHLCSAGRPSRWALAHILVCVWNICMKYLRNHWTDLCQIHTEDVWSLATRDKNNIYRPFRQPVCG